MASGFNIFWYFVSGCKHHIFCGNPTYKGIISHKGEHFDGEHDPIVPPATWDKVQALISERNHRTVKSVERKSNAPYLLKGLIFDPDGWAMTPADGGKNKRRRYRYYVSTKAIKHGYHSTDIKSISAEQIEPIVIAQLRKFFCSPEVVHRTHLRAQLQEPKITVAEVAKELGRFDEIWEQLFPLEQNRIMHLIVQRIEISLTGISITYQPNGIMDVYEQITGTRRTA